MVDCVECSREMRPRNTTAAQYPGTVAYNGERCSSCSFRSRDVPQHREPQIVTCSRCGITETFTGGAVRKYPLCRDCRDVMPRADWAAWAA